MYYFLPCLLWIKLFIIVVHFLIPCITTSAHSDPCTAQHSSYFNAKLEHPSLKKKLQLVFWDYRFRRQAADKTDYGRLTLSLHVNEDFVVWTVVSKRVLSWHEIISKANISRLLRRQQIIFFDKLATAEYITNATVDGQQRSVIHTSKYTTPCPEKKRPRYFQLQLSHFLVDFYNCCTIGNGNEYFTTICNLLT